MSTATKALLTQLRADDLKLGDIKKLAKEIKKDHALAMDLWATDEFHPRMLAVLILDKNELNQEVIDQMVDDLRTQTDGEQLQVTDWLMANQLTKSKRTKDLLESWQTANSPLLRRLFWYHQGRLRWMGKIPEDNADELLATIESDVASAEPKVQWAMNFTAGWIGVHDVPYRERCIELGERVGLYKDEPVAPNCTPNYLPEFIRIEVDKLSAS